MESPGILSPSSSAFFSKIVYETAESAKERLSDIITKALQNNDRTHQSSFSKGEASDYIIQAVHEISSPETKSELKTIYCEFLLKLLIIDIGIRDFLESRTDLIERLITMPVDKDNKKFVHFHVELVRFFYHHYASEISQCQEDDLIESSTVEDFTVGESKAVRIPLGEEQITPLDNYCYPHNDSLKSTQASLLEQIEELNKQVQRTESRNQSLQEANFFLISRVSEAEERSTILKMENSELEEKMKALRFTLTNLHRDNDILQKTWEKLQDVNDEDLHNTSEQLKNLAETTSPGFCTANGVGILRANVGKETSFKITVGSRDGHHLNKGGDPFQVQISGPGNVKARIEDHNDGTYDVKYTPTHHGHLSIAVTLRGKHIQDSPFEIVVSRDYTEIVSAKMVIGEKGSEDGQFNLPYGVSIDHHNHIIIADTDHHKIQIFDQNGHFIRKFGEYGDEPGQLSYPYGISITKNDDIVVADWGNHRVQIFDRNGQVLKTFGKKGGGEMEFLHPRCVFVDINDNIFVTDEESVQVYDSNCKFIVRFGNMGSQPGELMNPAGVVRDSFNRTIVADSDNHRIQIFDSEGQFVKCFGEQGRDEGQFNEPYGLVVDPANNILVTDRLNDRVQIFDLDGRFLYQFGIKGVGRDRFNSPLGISLNSKGDVFVVDYHNHRVMCF